MYRQFEVPSDAAFPSGPARLKEARSVCRLIGKAFLHPDKYPQVEHPKSHDRLAQR